MKETALEHAIETHLHTQYKVYTDGSSFEGGVGAAAILYKNNQIMKICQYHLGSSTEHTVYEAELIGIILALFLLMNLYCQMCNTIVIGLNNQASIRALANQDSKPAQYLLDHIHTTVENLQEKQDKIQNTSKFREAHRNKHTLVVCNRGVINLNIQWVPGHMDFALNDKADQHTKEAAKGLLSPSSELPKSLRKPLPASVSTL